MLEKNQGKNKKVSVYCLAYNHEKYIRNTLEGFVNQVTDFEYEVFVHDDASTDGTKKIIQEYERNYPEMIRGIYQTKNQYSQGKKIVANFIVPRLNGEYVAICEGDDYWCDTCKLQKQVDFLEQNPEYSACVHNTEVIEMDSGHRRLMNPSLEAYDLDIRHVLLEGGSDYHTSSVVYRMEYAKIVYSDECPDFFKAAKGFGDYPLAIYLTLKGKVKYLPDIMSVYRYGTPGSWSAGLKDIERFKAMRHTAIAMLKSVDEYTNYELHSHIQSIIEERYWEILMRSTDLRVLKNREIREVFDKMSLEQKVKTLIKLLFLNNYRLKRNQL